VASLEMVVRLCSSGRELCRDVAYGTEFLMASLHIILDPKNRKWSKPNLPELHIAVLDIGDMDYDKAALKAHAQRLAELLLEAIADNAFQEDKPIFEGEMGRFQENA
jgi:hypothetical protein